MSGQDDYWRECIEVTLSDHGVRATPEQIDAIAGDVQTAHENCRETSSRPPNPLLADLKKAERLLIEEREKITCRICEGTGLWIVQGPSHSSESDCWNCRGEGRVSP